MDELEFESDRRFRVGGHTFDCAYPLGIVEDGVLPVLKPREQVEALARLLDVVRPALVVELGIFGGGSTALINELARPRMLLAVDIQPEVPPALEQYLASMDDTTNLSVHGAVDQADRAGLGRLLDAAFADQPLDLVIDDASHHYRPTLASFELLFPRLRPGGVFVLEDWAAQHVQSRNLAQWYERATPEEQAAFDDNVGHIHREGAEPPLSRLVLQLVHLVAASSGAVQSVDLDESRAIITRGPGPLDRVGWALADDAVDEFDQLAVTP